VSGRNQTPAAQVASVKVGAILPLTGTAAFYGEQGRKGIEIAKILNEASGVQVEPVYLDSAYTGPGGVSAYQEYKKSTSTPRAIIVLASSVAIPLESYANQDQVVEMAVGASSDSYSTASDYTFRTTPVVAVQNKVLGEYVEARKFSKVAVLNLQNEFGTGAAKNFSGLEPVKNILVAQESYSLETSDFRSLLTKLKNLNPDAIYLAGTAKQYAQILKQADELGIKSQFLSTYSAEDPVILSEVGEPNLVYTYGFDPEGNDLAKKFSSSYKQKFGNLPDSYAAESYTAYALLSQAFQNCQSLEPQCLKAYFHPGKVVDTVFGSMTFDENGDVTYPFFLKTVKNGKFVRFVE
jgi:branched-chain amino acid transport system substrate-binding protein